MPDPREKDYNGALGKFRYNSGEFVLSFVPTPTGMKEYLRYIGRDMTGKSIVIPDGIFDISYMFRDSMLVSPPMIPRMVTVMDGCFQNCRRLERGAVLPPGLKKANRLYSGCVRLESVPGIPPSVEYAAYMFEGCRSLVYAPKIPAGLKDASGMFKNCREMRSLPHVPNTIQKVDGIFRGCDRLVTSVAEVNE